MEALLFLFSEVIVACLAPMLGILGAMFGVLIELVMLFISWLFSLGSKPRAVKPGKPLITRKALHWGAAVVGGAGVLAVLATIVFFQPVLRYVLTNASDRAGMVVNYEKASGMLLTGRVTLSGLTMTREAETGLVFDLRVDAATADVDLWSLWRSEPRIELARVVGMTGHVTPPARAKDAPRPKKKRRPFRVDHAEVTDVAVEIRPRAAAPYDLAIAQGSVRPFRSDFALFDLLFRSNLEAEVAGQPLRVSTREITADGRETIWAMDRVQADKLKLVVPKAPLTWLGGGTVSAKVEDRWSLSDDWIDMSWRIGMEEIDVQVPAGAGTAEKLLAAALDKVVAAKGGTATFRYELQLEKDQVNALRGGDLDQFWDVVLAGFMDADVSEDAAQDTADEAPAEPGALEKGIGKLKGLIQRGEDTE